MQGRLVLSSFLLLFLSFGGADKPAYQGEACPDEAESGTNTDKPLGLLRYTQCPQGVEQNSQSHNHQQEKPAATKESRGLFPAKENEFQVHEKGIESC